MGVAQGRQDHGGFELVEAVERAEGLHPGFGAGARPHDLEKRGRGRIVAAIDQDPLDRVPQRPVRAVDEPGHEGGGQAVEHRHGSWGLIVSDDPVNPPTIGARPLVQARQAFGADPARVFDDGTDHIDHVESPVRPGPDLDGAAPGIGGSEEFGDLFGRRPVPGEGHAIGLEDLAMDQVVDGLADEGVAVIGFAEVSIAVDERATGRGDLARALGMVEPLGRGADRVEPEVVGPFRQVDRGRGRGGESVAAGVMVGQGVMLDPRAVVAAELVSPVVSNPSLLGQAGGRLEGPEVGLDPEVATAERHLLAGPLPSDRAADQAIRAVDPVVEPVGQAVDAGLEILGREPPVEELADVGPAVAVEILRIQDVRCRADEHALLPGHHAGREREVVEEGGRPIISTVAVGVFQRDDPPAGLAIAVEAAGVVAHLADPELAVGSPVDRYGTLHQRFGGDKLNLETLGHPDRGESFGRRGPACRFFRGQERRRDEPSDRRDDLVLDPGLEPGRLAVIDHRPAPLVAPFAEDTLGGDVARVVVGVGDHPEPARVELGLEPEDVIDHDLAGEEDDRQVVAEVPGLDDVIELGLERLASIEPGELGRRVIAGGPPFGDQGLQFLDGRQSVERQLDPSNPADGRDADRLERALEEPGDLVADRPAVASGDFPPGAVLGIGVGPAADQDQGDRAGMVASIASRASAAQSPLMRWSFGSSVVQWQA